MNLDTAHIQQKYYKSTRQIDGEITRTMISSISTIHRYYSNDFTYTSSHEERHRGKVKKKSKNIIR